MLLLPVPPPRLLRSPVVLHGRVIAMPAEPRSPQCMPLESRQQPPPWRLLIPCSGCFLCTPAARRRCCHLVLGRLLRSSPLLLAVRIAMGLTSTALAAAVGGCLSVQLCVQRLQALPYRRGHINNGHICTAACTRQLLCITWHVVMAQIAERSACAELAKLAQ